MKWLRARTRRVTSLALLALAVQFALSFGHFHAIAAPTGASQSGVQLVQPLSGVARLVAKPGRPGQQPASGHDSGDPSDDACAICAVMAMAGTALYSTPPLLPLPQAVEFLYRSMDAELVHRNALRVAFQPRGPPLS